MTNPVCSRQMNVSHYKKKNQNIINIMLAPLSVASGRVGVVWALATTVVRMERWWANVHTVIATRHKFNKCARSVKMNKWTRIHAHSR